MKHLFTSFLFSAFVTVVSAQLSFHDYSAVTIAGDTISLAQYQGKKVMVVNTASFCAFTPQFDDLEALYLQYHSYNFEILGFPCNDFGNQDPHNDSTINDFCTNNYNVTFQMMSKVACVSQDTAPVYKWLQRADLNGVQNAHVSWNFNKFLIDEAGHWVRHFESATLPDDTAITNWILSPSVLPSALSEAEWNQLVQLTSATPANSSMEMKVGNSNGQVIALELYNTNGELMRTIFNGVSNGVQYISTPTVDLANGIYLLKIRTADQQKTLRLPVMH